MTTTTAKLNVLGNSEYGTDFDEFRDHLAAYCNQYVMEIAKPIMEKSEELFADYAVVMLVNLWFETDRDYEAARRSYLVQWSQYNPDDKYSFKPSDLFEFDAKKRNAYRDALDALLVR